MKKRYIDFVPVQTDPKSLTKKVSSTPVKPVENFSVHKTTITKSVVSTTVAPKTSMDAKPVVSSNSVTSVKTTITATPKPAPAPKTPTPKFINTEKVAKRPLSDSVAPKKPTILAPAEVASKPTPKKPKKIGTVLAIIITIVLGAAAGAIAFLLLPK